MMIGLYRSFRVLLAVVFGVASAALLSGAADAAGRGSGQVARAAPSAHSRVVISAGAVSQTHFVYDEPNSTTGSTEVYTLLPGMAASITIPGTRDKLVIATFGAESACYGGDVGSPDWCVVRIRVVPTGGGAFDMQPTTGDGTDFAFDSTDNGSETNASWEAHQMTRGAVLKPGTYRIAAHGRVKRFGTAIPTFWTGERTLTIQVANQ